MEVLEGKRQVPPLFVDFFSSPLRNTLNRVLSVIDNDNKGYDTVAKNSIDSSLLSNKYLIQGDSFPKLDIYKENDTIYVKATVAGLNKECLDTKIEDSTLIIKYTKDSKLSDKNKEYYINEIKHSNFERKLRLGDAVDIDNAEASCKDGILTIALPLKEEAKPKSKKFKL